MNVASIGKLCRLLPPVKEGCFTADEMKDIDDALKHYFGTDYVKTFMLRKYSNGMHFQGELYGSAKSLHSSSSLVYAKMNSSVNKATPGFITKFVVASSIIKMDNGSEEQQNVFLASM